MKEPKFAVIQSIITATGLTVFLCQTSMKKKWLRSRIYLPSSRKPLKHFFPIYLTCAVKNAAAPFGKQRKMMTTDVYRITKPAAALFRLNTLVP
ncbi:hypothetical protein [Deinococcus sp. PESE-13]